MIGCILQGGLGNFMFQLAAISSLARDNNSEACFPNYDYHMHRIDSDVFHNPNLTHAKEYESIFKNLVIIKKEITEAKKIVNAPGFYYDIKFIDNSYYSGFFQSEKFFLHNRDFIVNMFEPSETIKEYLFEKYSEVLKLKTCAIHVRRGDYLKLQDAHIVQDLNYYNLAMQQIGDVDKYLVFSDDIQWCKDNFIGEKFMFVEEDKDYNELFLMSMCSHNIIANSSFSWWGAWLNKNPNKIVVGPLKWYNENFNMLNDMPINSDDILSDSWIKI